MDGDIETPLGFWGNEAEEILAQHFPLHKACRDGDLMAFSCLVSNAKYEQLFVEDQFYSWTPIHWAAYFGKSDCLNGLLHCDVNVNIRTSKFQQTPLHVAAFGGHPCILLKLLNCGADYNAKDYLGETCLHKAARIGSVECIKTLISCGLTITPNRKGQTAYDIANDQNFEACAELLASRKNSLNSFSLMNGHFSENGSSGSPVMQCNGRSNGMNGHGDQRRKRTHEDISMPTSKRARTADCFKSFDPSFQLTNIPRDLNTLEIQSPDCEMGSVPNVQHCNSQNNVEEAPGCPQYEDEVFSGPVDLPPGFWTSVAHTDETFYSHTCGSY